MKTNGIRLLGCGDRDWDNYECILSWIDYLHRKHTISYVIEGEGRGADKLIRKAAQSLRIPVLPFFPQWKKFGRAAGPLRNSEMLHHGKPDMLIYFHRDLENSKGTKDMVNKATKKGIKIIGVDSYASRGID